MSDLFSKVSECVDAIAERIARYGWSYDERDRDGLADCFTSDGVWNRTGTSR